MFLAHYSLLIIKRVNIHLPLYPIQTLRYEYVKDKIIRLSFDSFFNLKEGVGYIRTHKPQK